MSAALLESEPSLEELLSSEALTAREWAGLLKITPRAVRMANLPNQPQFVRGGIAKTIQYGDLPPHWKAQLSALREKHAASSYGSLVSIQTVETRWAPQREWMTYPEATRIRALRKKAVAQVYYTALDGGRAKQEAAKIAQAEWLKQFGSACSSKTIYRLEKVVEKCGGIDFAPDEAYCDGKSCPHVMARREHKLQIPRELIEEFRASTTKMEHLRAAHRSLEADWMMGREIPGLGERRREGNEPFPFTFAQLRDYAAPPATRRLGSHGKARARREALPSMRTSTANLRRGELYMLDDSRLDIICTDDLTGRPIECRLYWMIDVGPRKIEGYVLREMGHIRASDVDALVTRVLRSSGLAAPGAGYRTTIKYERGTTACSPAREAFLLGAYPHQLEIDRTAMDGGKAHPGAPRQSASGHWMGKGHIESFMRTVSFYLQHIPGQRGGTFRRQPAQLGLQGRERESGYLTYDTGGQIHEAALLEYAQRALDFIPTGEVIDGVKLPGRLKVSALWPVSWIHDALREFVAYYNQQTDHRMEGFARIETIDPVTGAKRHRMESPLERAAALDRLCPTQRISASDAAFMIQHTAKQRTLRAGGNAPGITMDLEPWKGLRFWKPESIACHVAAQLATLERKHVCVYDEEAIRLWQPGASYTPEVHLLTEEPGKPGSRYLETLPLAAYGDRTDALSMAKEAEKFRAIEQRHSAELVRAAAPLLARRTAEAKENITRLQGSIAVLDHMRETAAPSSLIADIRTGRPVEESEPTPTRAAQLDGAAGQLAAFQAAHLPSPAPTASEAEPEIF